MKAIVCLGQYAKNSYYFEKLGISVFSMEELSYCLKENAFLLGREIMDDRLLRFIDVECDVPQLARELYTLVHQKGSLSAFVTIILEYVGFYDKATISEVENTIKSGSGLTDFEKQKLRTDHLAGKKKYQAAIEEYDRLIVELEELAATGKQQPILAEVLHNKGVALASLMMYGKAAQCFQRAYDLCGEEGMLKSFLVAKRMELSEKDYIALIAQMPTAYELSLQIESQVEGLETKWMNTTIYAGLQNMKEWNEQGNRQQYYEEGELLLEALKDEYRSGV